MPLAFAAARTDDAISLDLFDVIGDEWRGIGAKTVARFLAEHNDAKQINVRVNSPGGDVFEGATVFNLLRAHEAPVHVQILGLAASIASVVALAGDTVEIAENAMFMIHDPWGFVVGTADDMAKMADMLGKVKDTLLTAYERNSKVDRDKLAAMMSAETWMTADEALEYGFVDAIIPVADEDEPADDVKARARAVLEKFRRAPEGVGTRYLPRLAAMARHTEENEMKLADLIKALGLPEGSTEDDVMAAIAAKPEPASTLEHVVPRADYDAVRAQLDQIKAKAEKTARETFEADVDAAIASAVEAGKVTPAAKAYHRSSILARAKAGIEEGRKALAEFGTYVEGQPELVGTAQGERAQASATTGTTGEVKTICAQLGITVEQFEAARRDTASDPNTYHPEAYRHAL